MQQASYDVTELKAAGDGPQGLFAAKVSVFGNVDRNGDRVIPGAFTASLERWKASGKPIPVIWSHEHRDPESYIGDVDPNDIQETAEGLVVAGRLFIDDNPRAKQIYDLMQKNLIQDWSFSYEVTKERIAKDLARDVLEVNLFEVGPTLVGANPSTETLVLASAQVSTPDPATIKALEKFEGELDEVLETKIGRVLSAKTEAKIRAVQMALDEILLSVREEVADENSSSEEKAVEEPTPPSEAELRRREVERIGLFLAERGR